MYQENFVYGQALGAGLLADIASPDGDGPFPVILSVHGGRQPMGRLRLLRPVDRLPLPDLYLCPSMLSGPALCNPLGTRPRPGIPP